MAVTLREIDEQNRAAVLALKVAPEQERFVGSVQDALDDAGDYPQAKPWYRAVYADEEPVGFVMVSWNVQPQPPDIFGPCSSGRSSSTGRTRTSTTAPRSCGWSWT